MKKLLLVATVLAGGMTLASAGLNVSIGIGLPLPPLPPLPRLPAPPAVVIRAPAVCPPQVYIAPPVCVPRVIVSCPPPVRCEPRYERRHGHGRNWDRYDRGYRHGY